MKTAIASIIEARAQIAAAYVAHDKPSQAAPLGAAVIAVRHAVEAIHGDGAAMAKAEQAASVAAELFAVATPCNSVADAITAAERAVADTLAAVAAV